MNINSFIAKQFGKPTGFGGRIVTTIMNKQNQQMYKETERLLSLDRSEKVLDIGCGNGYMLRMLAERYDCSFAGIDVSESILKSAARRNRKYVQSGAMHFVHCAADEMVFSDSSFAKAYTVNTVYFWDSLDSVFKEIKRVLMPGGTFINTLYTNDTLARFSHTQFGYKRFLPEELIRAAGIAGFDATITPIMGGAAYCVICSS